MKKDPNIKNNWDNKPYKIKKQLWNNQKTNKCIFIF